MPYTPQHPTPAVNAYGRGSSYWSRQRGPSDVVARLYDKAVYSAGPGIVGKDGDHLTLLDTIEELEFARRRVEEAMRYAIAAAYEGNFDWTQIAGALNVSKQAAHRRYAATAAELVSAAREDVWGEQLAAPEA
jgi:hypothetical protein